MVKKSIWNWWVLPSSWEVEVTPQRLWSRRSWHRWPWSRHSRTRRNRRAGRTRRADLGFVRKSLNIQNRTKILFKMEDPINPLEFLIFCCCWEFSFKDVFFLVGFPNIFHTWMDGNALVIKFSSIMLFGDLFLPISSMATFFF